MEDERSRKAAPCMVLALCGLPGSGKTTLACGLAGSANCVEVRHISFDRVYEDTVRNEEGEEEGEQHGFEVGRWHEARILAFNEVEQSIREAIEAADSGSKPRRVLVIVDDNLYYRSMRQQCFQIARKYRIPFGQVYLKVPLEVALERNNHRQKAAQVLPEVIRRMHDRFEEPQPLASSWERHTITLQLAHESSRDREERTLSYNFEQLWTRIADIWQDNWVEDQVNTTQAYQSRARKDREESMANIIHQLDLKLRKKVATILSNPQVQSRNAGRQLAEIKRAVLGEVRQIMEVREQTNGTDSDEELLAYLEDEFISRCAQVCPINYKT